MFTLTYLNQVFSKQKQATSIIFILFRQIWKWQFGKTAMSKKSHSVKSSFKKVTKLPQNKIWNSNTQVEILLLGTTKMVAKKRSIN